MDTADDAARSWESAVDIVDASIPERITPAIIAKSIPCELISEAILTISVSESLRIGSAPASDTASPIIPMHTAAASDITTQIVATRLDIVSFLASSIAIKRRRI